MMSTATTDNGEVPVVPPPSLLPPYAFTTTTATGTFEFFPKLPIEVRRMIWNFTIIPRTVEVSFAKSLESLEHDFISDTPTILHVCAEAREEGLRTYTADLKTEHSRNGMYFNYELDTLYIRQFCTEFLEAVRATRRRLEPQIASFAFALPHKDKIQRVIFAPRFKASLQKKDAGPILMQFTNLKELGILLLMTDKVIDTCSHCDLMRPQNRTVFFNKDEFRHLNYLYDAKMNTFEGSEDQYNIAVMGPLMKADGERLGALISSMKTKFPEIQWQTPLVKMVGLANHHITEDDAYCKSI